MASQILSTKTKTFYSPTGQNLGEIEQVCVGYDDTSDITIKTPSTSESVHLLSLIYAITTAHTITFKSGTYVIAALPFDGATSLLGGYINTGILFTGTGEALKAALSGTTGTITYLVTTSPLIASAFFRVA